ncbi:hypothetical protein [Vitiosangium sp. GDMCC 1.1324]|uniref:hypothetical protein n=1 Tax=Vitiosangium sp. (strain GDMCC 1.1324) TaxID=2138576 RepID=UPI000D39E539|nr:hypothetical protein [Vitiosangium sp. GDMCC 1.1324]PTL79091.1 hypothetical protein DAT35_36390 [Vitiosangium sp. GDMCC 1.1324]
MAKARNYRARVKVEFDDSNLQKLRSRYKDVLRDLDHVVIDVAQNIADRANFSVPRGGAPDDPLNLADTSFVALPHHNPERMSTTATTGYEHPQAGPIHAGWHWGEKTKPPPNWLRNAAKRGARAQLRKGVAAQLPKSLAKFFPQK